MRNKQSIAWHEQCMIARNDSQAYRKRRLAELQHEYDQAEKENAFYQHQIQIAKNRNKDGFDSEKFLMKRKEAIVNEPGWFNPERKG
jgi:hypothetical protein